MISVSSSRARLACFVGSVWMFSSLVLAGEPSGPLAGFAASRTWSDKSGRFKIEAKLQHADEQQVRVLKTDGRSVTVPLAQLSEADRAFIDGFLKAEEILMA